MLIADVAEPVFCGVESVDHGLGRLKTKLSVFLKRRRDYLTKFD